MEWPFFVLLVLSLELAITSGSYNFSVTSSSTDLWVLNEREYGDIMFETECSKVYTVSAYYSVEGVCVNSHLQQEASLMKAKWGSDLCV